MVENHLIPEYLMPSLRLSCPYKKTIRAGSIKMVDRAKTMPMLPMKWLERYTLMGSRWVS